MERLNNGNGFAPPVLRKISNGNGVSASNGNGSPGNGHCHTGVHISENPWIKTQNGNGFHGNSFKNGNSNGGAGVHGVGGEVNGSSTTNGSSSASGCCWEKGIWAVGMLNARHKYLTGETFGFKVNANGVSLKKKQTWFLEPCADSCSNGGFGGAALEPSVIYLRSHLDKYLAVDQYGNVTCDSAERQHGTHFEVHVQQETGRWALRNVSRGYYLGAVGDKLTCTAKAPSESELWSIHLAARPQVTLKSVGRKRYAHLGAEEDAIYVDSNVPWGTGTLFTLEFRDGGYYALHSCNNKYLHREGRLQAQVDIDSLFSIEYHAGALALRDRLGLYLAPIGSKALLKTRSHSVTKDELFTLEDSLPQASFMAALNGRYVSVKQGVDVTANQDEVSNDETFQLEWDRSTGRWWLRTMGDKYWTLETAGGIQASAEKKTSNALFDLCWLADGAVAFRANNGRYVASKRSGHLYANAESPEDAPEARFYFHLINRPILVLKSDQGFVGFKTGGWPRMECNKATYETIQVEAGERGVVHLRSASAGGSGGYLCPAGDEVSAEGEQPFEYFIELREPTRICIKAAAGGAYLQAEKNGGFRLAATEHDKATKWEF